MDEVNLILGRIQTISWPQKDPEFSKSPIFTVISWSGCLIMKVKTKEALYLGDITV